MCSSNKWILIQNIDTWMSYCKGMESGHIRSSCKCVPICTLALKWGCYFQWWFTQCQLRYLCTLWHSEHRQAFTLWVNAFQHTGPLGVHGILLGSCESWWKQASLYIPAVILVFGVSRGGFLQTGLTGYHCLWVACWMSAGVCLCSLCPCLIRRTWQNGDLHNSKCLPALKKK